MVLYMDDAIGEFVAALQHKQMWEQTLFGFMSDNGRFVHRLPNLPRRDYPQLPRFIAAGGPVYQPGAANNHPLKGGKFSDWEGLKLADTHTTLRAREWGRRRRHRRRRHREGSSAEK